jgi:predicted Zn-ribbon and HTH transcriptional regulator
MAKKPSVDPYRVMCFKPSVVKAYLDNPSICPFCGSDELEGGTTEIDSDTSVAMPVGCNACDSDWVEVFTMSSIEVR